MVSDTLITFSGVTVTRNPVAFDLRIQRCVLNAQEPSRMSLIATSSLQSGTNKVGLKPVYFVLKSNVMIA